MRDQMKVGDGVLFYASNADPSGVTGRAEIVRGNSGRGRTPGPYTVITVSTVFAPVVKTRWT